MNLGELIVELSADSSELEKTLERAKKKAYEAAKAVEKSFEDIELKIGVDDSSLADLNEHLNLKVKHLKEVNKYFNNNPIVVNVDDSSLTDLNEHLNLKVKHLKEVNKYFDSNPIKVNTDTKSLDELEERLKKLSDKTITITVESELSKQLEKSLVDAVKEAVKDGMEDQESGLFKKEEKEKKESSPEKGKGMGRLVIEGMFTQVGENITRGLSQGLKDVSGADIETIARVTSNMILRYAGVGREAQNDPNNSKKKSTEITKDALKAIIRQYEQEAMGLGSIAPNKTVNESSKKQPKTAESSNKKAGKKLDNIVQDAILDLFLGGNLSENRIKNLAFKTVKKTLKTVLPHTYSTVENLTSDTTQATSTELKLSQAATSLQSAAQSLNNAANTLNNSVSATDLMVTTSAVQTPVEELQPLNVPLLPPSKTKKPKREPELVPVENTADMAQEQLKKHIKSIRSNTFQNLNQSRHYADATAKENSNELTPLQPIKAKKIDDIKAQKEISLENIRASFKAINQYFGEEYKKLTTELDQVRKTGTPAEIKATKEKFKKFIANSNSAIKDIDDTIQKAKETGFESHINSDLTAAYREGKAEIRSRQQNAIRSEGKLNTAEKDIANKQRQFYVKEADKLGITYDEKLKKPITAAGGVPAEMQKSLDSLMAQVKAKQVEIFEQQRGEYIAKAEGLGISVDAGLQKGIENGSDGVSGEARKMLDNLIKVVKKTGKIQSPSWVMFEIGMMIASGLFLGMQKGNSQVAVGARQLVNTVKDAVGSAKEILEPVLAIGGIIPGVSTAATYGSVGLAATDSGLKMLDKVGERHAANPGQTLFQSAFESGKDFVTELRADKTLTKPREAFDHFINLSKAGAATFGVNSFTAFDAAQSGMTALLRSGAIGKAVAQSHGETKSRLTKDPSLDYMATYKAVLTDKLKDLKLTKPEIIKAIGSALKVVPTGFGTAANSVAETAGMVFADGIDALTIPRNLYRNVSTKTAKGATHQQAIAESIADLGAPAQIADTIGSFGDKHSASLNTFARMSGNVVENINRTLINTVAASSKVVSSSTNAVSNQVKKNMGHLPSQQPINQLSSQDVSSATVASGNVSAKPFTSIGGNIMKGLGKGMADSIGSVTKAMDSAGNAIQSQIKQNMGISSPSKVMIGLGLMIASGLAVGIKKGAINVDGSMETVVSSINSGIKKYTNIKQFLIQSLNKNPNNVISQLIQSLKKDFGNDTILRNVFNSATSAFGKGGGLKDISVNFISSFSKGVLASTGGAIGAVSSFAGSVISAIKKVFGIASPSKIMMGIGLIFGNSFRIKALDALLSAKLAISQVMNDIVDNIRNIVSSQPPTTPPKLKRKTIFNMFADLSTADVLGATHRFISPILPKHLQSNDVEFYKQLYQGQNTPSTILKNTFDDIKSNIKPGGLIDGYLKLGTDLATNIFTAVSTSIRQTTLSGYASLGQVMRNAVNAALFSLSTTLNKPLHQALLSQTRSILPWFMKFIPRSFQLLPKLSFAIPLVGGLALKLGNSIVKNLLENNILKEGGFLTNLLSSITRINLPALPGVKKSNLIKGLGEVLSPLPFLMTASPIGLPLPFSSLISSLVAEPGSHYTAPKNPVPKKKSPTVEEVLQNQTEVNREKAKLRDVKGIQASKELVENIGNTLLDTVLSNLNIPVIPRSFVQAMVGKKLGEESGNIANTINSIGIERSKSEQLLQRTVQSGRTDLGKRADGLTKQILRERGVVKSVRDAMTPDQLAAARDNVLNNPLDVTKRERDFLRFEGDLEANISKKGIDVTRRTRDAKLIRILRERGVSNAEINNIRQSSNGLNDFAADLVNNPRTSTKGFVGKLTEAYAANDQDAMKELVKQGLGKAGMSAKQINNIDPRLLDTATAGLMTTLSGLQAKFKEKGFDMGKALAKGFKDSMVNLANTKDDLEYNAKKALGQANFGDSLGLIFRRVFRGTAATQDQFKEMYNQMGSGVKGLLFKNPKEGDEIFPNVLQFMGSIATAFAPITTMVGAITPLLLPLAPIITGIGMAVNMVAPHVAKLIDGIQRVEVLQRRFQFLGGSKEGGMAEFKYAKDIANKMNVPSEVAANSYSQIAIAAKDSKMEGQGVKDLFEGITSSLSALGISGQDASLVFMAYTQILAKGKLSMEELRQQLGEKFPPAMTVFAKAMGVSVPEMNALVASGSVLSQDILPKVAKVLKEPLIKPGAW